jgi:hypothetical protein
VFTKVNVVLPLPIPNTTPDEFTVATELLLLVQVPPDDGFNTAVLPMHIFDGPLLAIGVNALTVTALVASDGQRVVLLVNINVAVPPLTPVTTPAFVTVAMTLLLLVHVPPEVGLNVEVEPAHIVLAPVILTVGFALTVNGDVANEAHPVLVNV